MQAIESAQADVQVFAALKEGDAVLKGLQKQVSIEDQEELYASHKENMEVHQMEIEMFGEALNDDALADELDALVAEDAAAEMEVPGAVGVISAADAEDFREQHGITATVQEEVKPSKVTAPSRKMMAA